MRRLISRLQDRSRHGHGPALVAVVAALVLGQSPIVRAQQAATDQSAPPPPAAPTEQWRTSPFHGVIDGDGKLIQCKCLFRGQEYRLGEKVCMNTHLGTVMTMCDLQLNNTSWVPTREACTTS